MGGGGGGSKGVRGVVVSDEKHAVWSSIVCGCHFLLVSRGVRRVQGVGEGCRGGARPTGGRAAEEWAIGAA